MYISLMQANKKHPVFLYILPFFVLILIIGIPLLYGHMRAEAIQLDFKGVVDSVSYSEKDEPTVSIGGKSFVLPVNFWDFNKQIEVGDSLVKHKNSLTIEIIKKNGTVIIKN